MSDVFSRLFKDSTDLKSAKHHQYLQDNQKRENESIQVLQNNQKLSTKPMSLKQQTPFNVQKVGLYNISSRTQRFTKNKTNIKQFSKTLNRKEIENNLLNLNTIKDKKKEKNHFYTPKKELICDSPDEKEKNSYLDKVLDESSFSYIQKQSNLALTMPKLHPQLQIHHFQVKSIEKGRNSASRSQLNSARDCSASSKCSSRNLNKMKVKMKNGRFMSKQEVDFDEESSIPDKKYVDPRKFKKQIDHIENLICKNREKMRLGLGDDNETINKNNKKENSRQITPRLRKTSKTMTPNITQYKNTKKNLLSSSFNENDLKTKISSNLDSINSSQDIINLDDKDIEELNSRLNATLNKNLNENSDSKLDEQIDFDGYLKNGQVTKFGSQFDFLFGEDEMIQHKDILTESNDNKENQKLMVDQNFWNFYVSNPVQTEEDLEQNEALNENHINSPSPNSANSENNPIILETSINSPIEQNASNPMSTTLFSWELAGYANYLSDM